MSSVVVEEPQDPVHVVGHDDEGVEFDGGEAGGQLMPFRRNAFARGREMDGVIENVPEEMVAALCHDRDEVGTVRGVVVVAEADLFSPGWCVGHRGMVAERGGRGKRRPYDYIASISGLVGRS